MLFTLRCTVLLKDIIKGQSDDRFALFYFIFPLDFSKISITIYIWKRGDKNWITQLFLTLR